MDSSVSLQSSGNVYRTHAGSSPTSTPEYSASFSPSREYDLPERVFATDMYPVDRKINSYSKMDVLIDVLDILDGTPEYATVMNSCFGSLFSLPARRCSLAGKLIHSFLSRQLQCDTIDELWFTFAGSPLRFSITEFAAVTGLPCGPFPSDMVIEAAKKYGSTKSPHWYTLIGPSRHHTISDIIALLKSDRSLPGWRRLQLILVVIVDGILLCSTQPLKPTDEVVEMVKDTDFFLERYPWGRRSFELTIEMVKVGKKVVSQEELVAKLQQDSLVLHGFPIALQLYILQSVPMLTDLLPHPHDTRPFISRPVQKLTKLRCYHTCNILACENNPEVSVINVCPITLDGVTDARYRWLISLIVAGHGFAKKDWYGGDASLPRLCLCVNLKSNSRCRCGSGYQRVLIEDSKLESTRTSDKSMSCTKCDKLEKEMAALRRKMQRDNDDMRCCIMNEVRFLLASRVESSPCEHLNRNVHSSYVVGNRTTAGAWRDQVLPHDASVTHSKLGTRAQNSPGSSMPIHADPLKRIQSETVLLHGVACCSDCGCDKRNTDHICRVSDSKYIVYGEPADDDIPRRLIVSGLMAPASTSGNSKGKVAKDVHVHDKHRLPARINCDTSTRYVKDKSPGHSALALHDDVPLLLHPKMNSKSCPPSKRRHNITITNDPCKTSCSKKKKLDSANFQDYIPFSHPSDSVVSEFRKTLHAYKHLHYTLDGMDVPKSFFTDILKPTQWISNSHVDFMLRVLWKHFGGALMAKRVCVVDTLLTHLLVSTSRDFTESDESDTFNWHSVLVRYVNGDVSDRQERMAWFRDVDTIYAPMNWGKRHWVALVISLQRRHIEVLDPFISFHSDRKVFSLMAPIVKLLPYLINDTVSPNQTGYTSSVALQEFTFERVRGLYENTRGGDCGPLAVKFIEMHANDRLFDYQDSINDEYVDDIRMQYALQVYDTFVSPIW